jgi:hypothetical protein
MPVGSFYISVANNIIGINRENDCSYPWIMLIDPIMKLEFNLIIYY